MFDLPKYGDGVCLGRLAVLLGDLAIDRDRLAQRSVVVTGSNGKGSTAAMIAAIGQAFGLRTGLFTSPHLYRFNERFRIDGEDIADDALAAFIARVASSIARLAARGVTGFGAFEAQFALACLWFQQCGCDLMVFEAGIGGRYDPVRLVEARTACVVSVDLEHTALLGATLERIALDKSDACAEGGTVIYGENCLPLKRAILAHNSVRGVASVLLGDDAAVAPASQGGIALRWSDLRLAGMKPALAGAFQANNAAVAAMAFAQWLSAAQPNASRDALASAVQRGVASVRWPGRLEVVRDDPLTVIDVGHTPDAITQAWTSLAALHGGDAWLLVLGVSADKKVEDIAALLAPRFARILVTRAHHKGAPVGRVAEAARAANPHADVTTAETIAEAVAVSTALARKHRDRIYVAGGLFLAAEYAYALRGGAPRTLTFF